jgi:hypothetical protein
MCCEGEAGNFTTSLYSVLFNAGKSLLKMTETLRKTNLINPKDVRIIHANFPVIATTLPEEKIGVFTFVSPLVFSLMHLNC